MVCGSRMKRSLSPGATHSTRNAVSALAGLTNTAQATKTATLTPTTILVRMRIAPSVRCCVSQTVDRDRGAYRMAIARSTIFDRLRERQRRNTESQGVPRGVGKGRPIIRTYAIAKRISHHLGWDPWSWLTVPMRRGPFGVEPPFGSLQALSTRTDARSDSP